MRILARRPKADLPFVPAGLWRALRLVPPAVLAEARAEGAAHPARLARSGWGLALTPGLSALALWNWCP
ncbi:hypothetical protein QOL99_03085 [Deinococcus sp. MIMF12]|uniref:Uncharacterized protein n=1 Tax=Deinococcus rhizophilus TaxID=3049544 RepID=A0ABT7JHH6_9DEIO|nr:hypothetical protein [Deinococcus rhizophilus]MDL2343129.1 hypothetical protein [Deinococcus rhizophilus]